MSPASNPGQARHRGQAAATVPDGSKPIVLSAEETTMVREVLVACSQMLTWAQRHSGPAASALPADMTRPVAGGRSPESLLYRINLAIDYLDFAPPARRPQ